MDTPGRFGASIMKHAVAACAAVAIFPALAAPQSSTSGLSPFAPLAPIGLPLAPIGLPLAPIGLPLPQLGLPPLIQEPVRESGRRGPERHRGTPKSRSRGHGGAVVYVVPSYAWGMWAPGTGAATATVPGTIVNEAQEVTTGVLQLAVEPAITTQVYVDGYFIGTSDDAGNALELDAGPHRVELRANGYKPHVLDTRITARRTLTYQATLEPVDDPAAAGDSSPAGSAPSPLPAGEPPSTPTTIYFIPGCYLGNLPPQDVRLTPGCDLSRLQIYRP